MWGLLGGLLVLYGVGFNVLVSMQHNRLLVRVARALPPQSAQTLSRSPSLPLLRSSPVGGVVRVLAVRHHGSTSLPLKLATGLVS